MFNVIISMHDNKRDLIVAQFVVYRYSRYIDAHLAAKELNDKPRLHWPPSIQHVVSDIQYLYPETLLAVKAVARPADADMELPL